MTALKPCALARDHTVQISLNIYGRGESDYMAQLRRLSCSTSCRWNSSPSRIKRDLAAVYRQHDAFCTRRSGRTLAATPLEAMALRSAGRRNPVRWSQGIAAARRKRADLQARRLPGTGLAHARAADAAGSTLSNGRNRPNGSDHQIQRIGGGRSNRELPRHVARDLATSVKGEGRSDG